MDYQDYDLIIVGDIKTPNSYHNSNCIFLDIKKQKELYPKFSELLPYNHYCRKNLGYLYAIQNNYDIIYETDDDNLIYDNFDDIINQIKSNTNIIKDKNNNWINIFKYFTTNKNCWPRGFPLTQIHNKTNFEISKQNSMSSIIQGLVDNDPDVDSLYRLSNNEPIDWEKNKIINVSNENMCVFNTQNTFWINKKLFICMFIPCTVSFRYCDILRSIICNSLLYYSNNNLSYISPNVIQERNEHNLIEDFKSEYSMFIANENIFDYIYCLPKCLYLIQCSSKLPDIYSCLKNKNIVVLSYKEETEDTTIFYPNSTWTTGRNKLREYALSLKEKYDYYIYLDEDIIFKGGITQKEGFRQFEHLLDVYKPLIGNPQMENRGWYNNHGNLIKDVEAQSVVCFDGIMNAYSKEIFSENIILPYDDHFDKTNWWGSQIMTWIKCNYYYKNKVILFPQLKIRNTLSSDYPQEIDETLLLSNLSYESFTDKYLYNKLGWDESYDWTNDKNKQIKIEKQIDIKQKLKDIYDILEKNNIIKQNEKNILNKWLEYF
tara:strand:- start:176 stop:1810 length:1635 start_codon:yes stop_codon:yes gene_type:complete